MGHLTDLSKAFYGVPFNNVIGISRLIWLKNAAHTSYITKHWKWYMHTYRLIISCFLKPMFSNADEPIEP